MDNVSRILGEASVNPVDAYSAYNSLHKLYHKLHLNSSFFRTLPRVKRLEQIVAQSANYSFLYADNVLLDRFQEGENAIKTSPTILKLYVRCLLHNGYEQDHLMAIGLMDIL